MIFNRRNNNKLEDMIRNNEFYIANQGNGGFDEIQKLAIALQNEQPVCLEGEPGVGKNQAVKILANSLGKDIYRIRCTEEMMLRDIVGGDKLVTDKGSDGSVATKTKFEPGKLLKAMEENKFGVLDEVNQLLPTVQKGLNSALEDQRTLGGLEGGYEISAQNGFGLFLTYNPGTGVANADLEPAVRDRCKVIYFEKLPTDLKARIALLGTEEFELSDFLQDDKMKIRGLQRNNNKLGFVEYTEGNWYKYKGDVPVNESSVHPYLYFDRTEDNDLTFQDEKKEELYQAANNIVRALDRIDSVSTEGTSGLAEELGMDEIDNVSRLNVNRSSPRLVKKLVEDYILLRNNQYSPADATNEVVSTIVDYTVPSEERKEKIGENLDMSGLVKKICESQGLMTPELVNNMKDIAYETARESMVKALRENGYSEGIAKKLLEEYM